MSQSVRKLFVGSNAKKECNEAALAFGGYSSLEECVLKGNILIDKETSILVEDIQCIYTRDTLISKTNRICIIHGLDNASDIIQNKLLKVLEDGSTSFFISASEERGVLPTVRSRCIVCKEVSTSLNREYIAPFLTVHEKTDIFKNLCLYKEKDPASFFNDKNIVDVLSTWREFFFVLYSCAVTGDELCVIEGASLMQFYSPEALLLICEDIENDMQLTNYTKDDFFMLIQKMVSH